MAADILLKEMMSNLEDDFSSFRKSLNSYKYVVDMTRIDPQTTNKVEKMLNSKYPRLKNYVDWEDTITVNKQIGKFFVLNNKIIILY